MEIALIIILITLALVVPCVLLIVYYYWGPKGKAGGKPTKDKRPRK